MKINAVKKITTCDHLNLFSVNYNDRKNCDKNWIFASRSTHPNPLEQDFSLPDAVVIVPYHCHEKKLVLIKEFRVVLGGYQYGFPAGLVDKGETIQESAARELKEETGLTVLEFKKISPPIYSSSGMTDESVSMVYVDCAGDPSNEGNTGSEDIQPIFVSPEEASAICNNDDLKVDVKTWLVLSVYGETGRI